MQQINEEKKEGKKDTPSTGSVGGSQNGNSRRGNRERGSEGKRGRRFRGNKRSGDVKDTKNEPGRTNSPEWYKKDLTLFTQAAHISTYHTNGTNYHFETIPHISIDYYGSEDAVGAMANLVIGPGRSVSVSDPFNHCMIDYFNHIRGKYTSNVPFQANDLGCYFLAIGNALALASEIKRDLNIVNLYDKSMLSAPAMLLHMDSVGDYAAERISYAANLFRYNSELVRLETLSVPAKLTFLARCGWITSGFFYDDECAMRGNIYGYRLYKLYKWRSDLPTHDKPELKASGLEVLLNDGTSIGDKISKLTELVDALVLDDNVRQISGWLEQYYQDYVYTNEYLDVATAQPSFNSEIKTQFRNIRCIPSDLFTDIAQDTSKQCLYLPLASDAPQFVGGNMFSAGTNVMGGWLVNYTSQPNDDDIMVGTRFTPGFYTEEGSAGYYDADLISCMSFTLTAWDRSYRLNTTKVYQLMDLEALQTTDTDKLLDTLSKIRFLDMSPLFMFGRKDGASDKVSHVLHFNYQKDYTFYIPEANLHNLNVVSIYSQFDLPEGLDTIPNK